MATKVIHPHFCLMFTGDQQQMLKTQLTDSRTLPCYLIFVQRLRLIRLLIEKPQ